MVAVIKYVSKIYLHSALKQPQFINNTINCNLFDFWLHVQVMYLSYILVFYAYIIF